MSEYAQIVYEKLGRVARVTMNRPDVRNAQSRRMREEMDAAFAEAVADEEVRVVVLAGAGDDFSSGHDLGTPEERADQERRPYPAGVRGQYQRTWDLNVENSLRWRELPKPTIAQVQGYCIFGGWIVASAMDLIVAADDARFVPGLFQYFSVPWDLGPRKTKEILWQSRMLDAREALELGFVNRVVKRPALAAETLSLAESIAEMDPFLARMIKFSVNQMQDAMGFRTTVQATHANFMLNSLNGGLGRSDEGQDGKRRLGAVARIIERGL